MRHSATIRACAVKGRAASTSVLGCQNRLTQQAVSRLSYNCLGLPLWDVAGKYSTHQMGFQGLCTQQTCKHSMDDICLGKIGPYTLDSFIFCTYLEGSAHQKEAGKLMSDWQSACARHNLPTVVPCLRYVQIRIFPINLGPIFSPIGYRPYNCYEFTPL